MTLITLTWPEMYLAAHVATMRNLVAMRRNLRPRYGAPQGDAAHNMHLLGCQGEMAVAKALGLFWSGTVGELDAIDIGDCVEVRTSARDPHDLILHKGDRDFLPFVSVLAKPPVFELQGWIWGHDGKRAEYWADTIPRPCFFVPLEKLNPNINELHDYVREHQHEHRQPAATRLA